MKRWICTAPAMALLLFAAVTGCTPPGIEVENGGSEETPAPIPPKIVVYFHPSPGTNITVEPAGTMDPGIIFSSTERDLRMSIRNAGFDTLLLTESPTVRIYGTDASRISILTQPGSSLEPGETEDFTLRISPPDEGSLSALLSIPNSDPDRNLFNFVISGTVIRPSAAVAATGQTDTFATGDDGDLQAGIPWPDPRFEDNGDGTVTDHLTGLMWASESGTILTTWEGALSSANASTLGDWDDWRLPNVNELMSLVNTGSSSPNAWLNAQTGISGIQNGRYWASTWIFQNPTLWGWVVHMNSGMLGRANISAIPFAYSWKVRDAGNGTISLPRTGKTERYRTGDDGDLQAGTAWPSPRFVDNGEGMILDLLTGLVWQDAPSETVMTWEDALIHVDGLDIAGFTDWRMPQRNEMRSLCSYGSVTWNTTLGYFFGSTVPAGLYWTSSSREISSEAWTVTIETGHSIPSAKTGRQRVWAVRGTG